MSPSSRKLNVTRPLGDAASQSEELNLNIKYKRHGHLLPRPAEQAEITKIEKCLIDRN